MQMTEIKFRTAEHQSKLTEGKVCYQGQLEHNQMLSVDETRQYLAEYLRMNEPMTGFIVDGIAAFMRDYLAKGYRLDFGGFTAELRMRGGFDAANAPFDPKRNSIAVDLTPGKKIKGATRRLKPVNVTFDEKERIFHSRQLEPFEIFDAIARDGERLVEATGVHMKIDSEATDEGVWIESDAGERLLSGVVQSCDQARVVFKLTGVITPGRYWLVVSSRALAGGPLLRATRRLTAV